MFNKTFAFDIAFRTSNNLFYQFFLMLKFSVIFQILALKNYNTSLKFFLSRKI